MVAAASSIRPGRTGCRGWNPGQCLTVDSDVVERPHPLLGWIWGPEEPLPTMQPIRKQRVISAGRHPRLELLERTAEGDRLQVTITTGRPHQIRIHLAQLGSPLLGDPLYLLNREIDINGNPLGGDGGYRFCMPMFTDCRVRVSPSRLFLPRRRSSLAPDWGIRCSASNPSIEGLVTALQSHVSNVMLNQCNCIHIWP